VTVPSDMTPADDLIGRAIGIVSPLHDPRPGSPIPEWPVQEGAEDFWHVPFTKEMADRVVAVLCRRENRRDVDPVDQLILGRLREVG
jgi:hypothetical protein